MEIKKVLLPIDGSERSKRTVRMVKRVCRPEECEIYIYPNLHSAQEQD